MVVAEMYFNNVRCIRYRMGKVRSFVVDYHKTVDQDSIDIRCYGKEDSCGVDCTDRNGYDASHGAYPYLDGLCCGMNETME